MWLFKNLKARILKSIITWSEMGKQTAQAKEVYLMAMIGQWYDKNVNDGWFCPTDRTSELTLWEPLKNS